MPKLKKLPYNFKLADVKLDGYDLTEEEKGEINVLGIDNARRKELKYIFLLLKKGYSENDICSILDMDYRTLRKIINKIKISKFLNKQLDMALSNLAEDLADSVGDVLEGDVVDDEDKDFNEKLREVLEEKMSILINSITVSKIYQADLDKVASSFAKLFDKYRTLTGQSNINIFGVQALVETKESDSKKLQKLMNDLSKIDKLLKEENASGDTEQIKKSITGITKKSKERD